MECIHQYDNENSGELNMLHFNFLSRISTTFLSGLIRKHDFDILTANDLDLESESLKM